MVLYKESARKHGYNERDIERVLDHPITTTEGNARDGSLMVVKTGFASNADHIEVFYQYHPRSGEPVVFHAQKC